MRNYRSREPRDAHTPETGIPTCVGKTLQAFSTTYRNWVHPHVRGADVHEPNGVAPPWQPGTAVSPILRMRRSGHPGRSRARRPGPVPLPAAGTPRGTRQMPPAGGSGSGMAGDVWTGAVACGGSRHPACRRPSRRPTAPPQGLPTPSAGPAPLRSAAPAPGVSPGCAGWQPPRRHGRAARGATADGMARRPLRALTRPLARKPMIIPSLTNLRKTTGSTKVSSIQPPRARVRGSHAVPRSPMGLQATPRARARRCATQAVTTRALCGPVHPAP